jgi:hypothetical protein
MFPLLAILVLTTGASEGQGELIERGLLIDDVRQLADIVESAHPDPYTHGGGRIAFHRRLHELLLTIPDEGMSKDDFVGLLRPFLASIGDQHTSIYTEYSIDGSAPGGVPFVFEPVEHSLYVLVPFLPDDEKYIGSLLVSVEGVHTAELLERFTRLEGAENEYFVLRQLGRSNLLYEPYLRELVPEWTDRSSVTIELQLPSGETQTVTRGLPVSLSSLRLPESRVSLPKTDDSGFVCDFLDFPDYEQEIAYLRVDHMLGYREAREMAVAAGAETLSVEEIAAVRSATESFRSLAIEMKEKSTRTLIVDIRRNGGGNYMMAPILTYFLYGKDVLIAIPKEAARSGGGSGKRYSELYFNAHPKMTLRGLNEGRGVPLVIGDIDFARIMADVSDAVEPVATPAENSERLKVYRRASTFFAEYESGAYSGHYLPENVFVLMTPWTSSSGLDMALFLYRAGATLIGTPSGQAPNSWGNLLEWTLDNSGIRGEVSSSFEIAFGDDPDKGRVLPVHYQLTYEKLASYQFDHNAIFLLAMDMLKDQRN